MCLVVGQLGTDKTEMFPDVFSRPSNFERQPETTLGQLSFNL
jgi:hypothetical protein